MSKRNLYEVLNSQPNASFDELKVNYKQLILQCHPDKLPKDNNSQDKTKNRPQYTKDLAGVAAVAVFESIGDHDNGDPNVDLAAAEAANNFVLINKAWQTLKDPAKRKLYDAELLLTKFQTHSNIYERLTLSDMERHQELQTDDETDQDNLVEKMLQDNKKALEMSGKEEKKQSTHWYYTYACRCGGQYIINDSAINEIFKQSEDKSNSSANDCDRNSSDVDCSGVGVDEGSEIVIECNECSLVIVLEQRHQETTAKYKQN